jgi:hypothetical protein
VARRIGPYAWPALLVRWSGALITKEPDLIQRISSPTGVLIKSFEHWAAWNGAERACLGFRCAPGAPPL